MKGTIKCTKCGFWYGPEEVHACRYTKADFDLDVNYLAALTKVPVPITRTWLRHLIKKTGGKIE